MIRVDQFQAELKSKIRQVEEETFKHPPQSFESFKERLGWWLGLNAALNAMNELVNRALKNEEKQ